MIATSRHHAAWRFPLLALGMAALLAGLAGGLLRMGWGAGEIPVTLGLAHGPLTVSGFLGTLICLERAVALRKLWGYAVPLVSGIGGVAAMFGAGAAIGAPLFAIAAVGLIGLYVAFLRLQAEPYLYVMALGAGAWLVGNLLWASGAALYEAVPWWMGFLVLTIAGERLELSRMLQHCARVRGAFLTITAALLVALAATMFAWDIGSRLGGVALLALAAWLAHYDVARYTIRQTGLTRFIAVCLLTGYVWLAIGGLLGLVYGGVVGGPVYDAVLHAVFVGFVFSMVFGHAPIIFPSVLNVPPFYRPRFYVHLALLHASLLARIVGDLAGWLELRTWGGLLNAAAILLFLGSTVIAVVGSIKTASRRKAPSEEPDAAGGANVSVPRLEAVPPPGVGGSR